MGSIPTISQQTEFIHKKCSPIDEFLIRLNVQFICLVALHDS